MFTYTCRVKNICARWLGPDAQFRTMRFKVLLYDEAHICGDASAIIVRELLNDIVGARIDPHGDDDVFGHNSSQYNDLRRLSTCKNVYERLKNGCMSCGKFVSRVPEAHKAPVVSGGL